MCSCKSRGYWGEFCLTEKSDLAVVGYMCVDGHRWWGDHWHPQWVGSLWDPIVGFQFRVQPGVIVLLHLLVVFHSAKTIGSLGGESYFLLAWMSFILDAENTVKHTDAYKHPFPRLRPPPPAMIPGEGGRTFWQLDCQSHVGHV